MENAVLMTYSKRGALLTCSDAAIAAAAEHLLLAKAYCITGVVQMPCDECMHMTVSDMCHGCNLLLVQHTVDMKATRCPT